MPKKNKDPDKSAKGKTSGKSKSLDDQKAAALNIFEEEGDTKKTAKSGKGAEEGSVFGHLGATGPKGPRKSASGKQDEDRRHEAGDESVVIEEGDQKIIHIKPPIVVRELSELMGLKPFKVIQELMELEVFANQNQSIEPDIAAQICEKHGFVFEQEKREKGGGVHKVEEVIEEPEEAPIEEVEEDKLQLRPPVVTFMGHVDHGKTSLLDAYRGSRIVKGEAGGITQHMGAYQVERNGKRVTFLDTPGHAAFSEMRARGADVTDIVVLVVAADDGLMPTTFEAIDHCRAAAVTIIVAINKIDLPRADLNKVKGQLQEHDLAPEDWGGSTICVEVSATEGTGLDELFEMIHLQAEVLELKSDPSATPRAIVIEARSGAGKGPTATVVIQNGTLKVGDSFICGNQHGKVKALINDQRERIDQAGPAMPVEVVGFSGIPNVGDELIAMESGKNAKKLSAERLGQEREQNLNVNGPKSALETLFANIEEGKKTVLKLILKADVQGSLQAITGALEEIESDKVSLNILRQGIGPITEADGLLATASDAVLIGFNTKVESKAQSLIKREGVQVKLFSVIYELIDQVKEAMLGLLEPETREKIIGHAKVTEVFKLSSGRVGGCVVTDGVVRRAARARVIRGDVPIYDGGFSTLRRFKDDVKEVKNGLECGIKLGKFNDYAKEDIIECYELEKLDKAL